MPWHLSLLVLILAAAVVSLHWLGARLVEETQVQLNVLLPGLVPPLLDTCGWFTPVVVLWIGVMRCAYYRHSRERFVQRVAYAFVDAARERDLLPAREANRALDALHDSYTGAPKAMLVTHCARCGDALPLDVSVIGMCDECMLDALTEAADDAERRSGSE